MSFGERVREQVLEVIIRQAIAGAPWKEICQGPMAVNNITDEEVQMHVDYLAKVQSGSTDISITEEERQKISDYVADWDAIQHSCLPIDLASAQSAVNALYAAYGFSNPLVVFCESPVQAALYFELLHKDCAFGNDNGSHKDALRSVKSKLSKLPQAVQERFWTNLDEQKSRNSLIAEDSGAIITSRMEVAIWDEIIGVARHEMLKRLSHDLIACLRLDLKRPFRRNIDALRLACMEFEAPNGVNSQSFAFRTSPDRWGAWQMVEMLPYLFPIDCIDSGFYRNAVDCNRLKLWVDVARQAPSGIYCEKVAYLLERPCVLATDNEGRLHNENGPAAAFKDGYRLYAWRGIILPEDVITKPELITVERIESIENVELRRAMTEIFGVTKYLNESGAELIQEDECGQLYRKNVPGDEPLQMVRVVNSTPEADGTSKVYFLRVPPFLMTAREGVAWTFSVAADEYAPTAES